MDDRSQRVAARQHGVHDRQPDPHRDREQAHVLNPEAQAASGPDSIILFDGVCNFCNRTVQFILPRDKQRRFRFAALQSETARELQQQFHWPDETDSIIVVEGDRYYTRSTAALRIVRKLPGLWPVLSVFAILPRAFRDFLYDAFARRRYRWFGKRDSCLLPSPGDRERFLD